jgi:AraC family transcriptional regulator of arabinose operon
MDNFANIVVSGDEAAYAPGHGFRREPGFPYYTLNCLISGSLLIRHAGGESERQAVSLGLTPPCAPYSLSATGAHRELWIIFTPRPEWRPWLNWGQPGSVPCDLLSLRLTDRGNRAKILRCLRNVLEYSRSSLPAGQHLAELALEQALVLAFSLAARGGVLDERLERVVRSMRLDLAQPWRENELAKIANLSPSRFAHLFREKLGVAPLKFLEQLRMEKAKALLLATAATVKVIAAEVGYPDALHFSGRFRRVVGRCPSRFRHAGTL